ncbi:hypothetical protein FD755_004847, partial [Muntiacus reevesi]
GAFRMGIINSGISQVIKSFHNSLVGVNHRQRGNSIAIKTRVPQLGGNFAVWRGLFSETDCTSVGGILLAPIEGTGILLTTFASVQFPKAQLPSSPFGDYCQY